MTVKQASEQLLEIVENKRQEGEDSLGKLYSRKSNRNIGNSVILYQECMHINRNANLKNKDLKNDLKLMYINCHFSAFTEDTVCVGLSQVGSDAQRIVSATLQEMTQIDLGEPLHSLIIPGEMHSLERDMLLQFAISDKTKNILSSLCI